MNTVAIKPELLDWAIQRSRVSSETLIKRFPKFTSWGKEKYPTLKQLEQFARMTFTPLGYFFLPKPPEDKLPIIDYRTVSGAPIEQSSPNLIETIQIMQRRQTWLREYLIKGGEKPLDFVASITLSDNKNHVAQRIKNTLRLNDNWAQENPTWGNALKSLSQAIEKLGVLIIFNGVVGNNTHRILDVEEFRGFILSDKYAPIIFINNRDAKAAQMFTVVHELIHLWLGVNGVINFRAMQPVDNDTEKFCDGVAAEFLVPEKLIREYWPKFKKVNEPFHELARQFKVSPIVCARRALDLKLISKPEFFKFYDLYSQDMRRRAESVPGGGNFYATQNARIGRRFAEAIRGAIGEGKMLYSEAYRLTGLNGETFDKYIKPKNLKG